ncbi:MAG: hypothetical protein ACOC04_01975 [Halothece sp.]
MKAKQILLLSIGLLSPLALIACEPPDDMPPAPNEDAPQQPEEPGEQPEQPGDDSGGTDN